jgi:hypothetical protein
MAVEGFEQHKPPEVVWANSWFDLGLALVIIGLATVCIALFVHFRRAGSAHSPAVPGSRAFHNVDITDRSQVDLVTSAEYIAVDSRISGDAIVRTRHLPGRPDLLGKP